MLFLDFLLLVMIIICIVYCWMLNRRIQDLQNSRVEFSRMIKELNASIVKAENNVIEMSRLSKITSTEIKSVVEEAKEISGELGAINDAASDLAIRLNKQRKSLNKSLYELESASNSASSSYISPPYIKSEEKYVEVEVAAPQEGIFESKYTNQLKNFIHNIVSPKKTEEPAMCLNQISYYDSLRKINVKK